MKCKRIISLLLALVLTVSVLCSGISAVGAPYYSDVSSSASYYNAVCYLYDHNIMRGTSTHVFSPSLNVTRGQMVTIMWRMLNTPNPVGKVTSFSDCSSSAYYYDAVKWASSSGVGIVNGYGGGLFGPNNAVTQQDTFVMLYRFACYCGYISNSTSNQAKYKNALSSSNLTYKNNVSEYAKAAFGWAYSVGLTLSKNVKPSANCIRANTAQYVYKIYTIYQKKYALTVVNTNKMSYATDCGTAMATLFKHYGATCTSKTNITKSSFSSAMQSAFSSAKALDICYLFFQSHGSTSGLRVFSNGLLTPTELRSQINKYKGTFVAFISGCNTGTYISEGIEENGNGDVFDADLFVNILTGQAIVNDNGEVVFIESDLTGSNRIKVLCSSMKAESSYSAITRAVKFWCLGAGYNLNTGSFSSLAADTDKNSRISLEELFTYSRTKVLNIQSDQHIVRYPANDRFIIIESGY